MTLEDFASAVTGLAAVDVVGDVRGLDRVGKVKVLESRQTTYPGNSYDDRANQESYIVENCQEEGKYYQHCVRKAARRLTLSVIHC